MSYYQSEVIAKYFESIFNEDNVVEQTKHLEEVFSKPTLLERFLKALKVKRNEFKTPNILNEYAKIVNKTFDGLTKIKNFKNYHLFRALTKYAEGKQLNVTELKTQNQYKNLFELFKEEFGNKATPQQAYSKKVRKYKHIDNNTYRELVKRLNKEIFNGINEGIVNDYPIVIGNTVYLVDGQTENNETTLAVYNKKTFKDIELLKIIERNYKENAIYSRKTGDNNYELSTNKQGRLSRDNRLRSGEETSGTQLQSDSKQSQNYSKGISGESDNRQFSRRIDNEPHYRFEIYKDGVNIGGLFQAGYKTIFPLIADKTTGDTALNIINILDELGDNLDKPDVNFNGVDSKLLRSAFTKNGLETNNEKLNQLKSELKKLGYSLVRKDVQLNDDNVIFADKNQSVYFDDIANVSNIQFSKRLTEDTEIADVLTAEEEAEIDKWVDDLFDDIFKEIYICQN